MNQNTFSEQSGAYARARPRYPTALYEWFASQAPARDAVWDCATGSGQAAVGLSPHFRRVHATDASAEQLRHATDLPNIGYQVAAAEASGLEHHSVDAIAVAQALHWFDHERFWPEVLRVGRPGAFFCAWGYSWMVCPGVVNDLLLEPYRELLLPFWPHQNRILWDGYQPEAIAFPFEPIPCPGFEIEVEWTLDQIIDYMGTWSAYKLSRSDPHTVEATRKLAQAVRSVIDPAEILTVRMPLAMVGAYLPGR